MAIQGAMQVQIPASAVGANGYTFTINWPLAGVDLTTADTLSGNIRLTETGDPFPISGVLTATGANELTWKLHSSDTLTQGTAEVQFRATFGTDNIISAPSKWLIYNTLSGTLPPPDPSAVSFIRNNGDGTYSFLNAADFRTAIGAGTGDGDMPLVDPAVVGNLVTLAPLGDGSLVDAGTQIVLEQDPDQPTAARNRLATGAAPNTLGIGAVDLQGERNAATQVASGDYSHAEGNGTTASENASHAEGLGTTASGFASHAEGLDTTASGIASHAEGANTTASGIASHAEGSDTTASGIYSHAGGRRANAIQDGTYARSDSQNTDFSTIIADEYAVRARGGVRLVTATDGTGVPTKTTTLDTGGVWRLNDNTARGLQRTELGLGTAAVEDATAFDAAGSAAGVQSNLDTHTGDATIHFTQAAISITPAQAGADPAGSAAGVQSNLDTHTGLTGTAVHGLGTASTEAETAFARLAGRAGGQTLIGGTGVNNAVVLQGTSSGGNTATAIGAQIKVGDAGATNAVTVLNNGNVGIGTNLPGNTLHIERTLATNTVGIFMNIISSGGEGNGFLVRAGGANSGRFSMRLQNAAGDTHFNMLSNGTCAIGGGVTFRTGMRSFISADAAAVIGQVIQLAATPTANAQEIRNSAGAVLSATRPDGSWQPPQIADAAAVNNSLYYSTTSSQLVYKDPAGVVNALY